MPKQALFSRQQPGGFNDYVSFDRHPGDIWFVGSAVTGATDATGYGMNPDTPFATLDYAVGQCTSGAGDVIYVLPGHIETVTAAGGLDLDVIGITIRGIGEGALRPYVNLTTAIGADVDIDAASITVENIEFRAGFEDITAAIDVNATDCTFRRCRFIGDTTNDHNALIWIQDAAAAASDRITVEDCYCRDLDTANTNFINLAGTGREHVIRRNVLIGDWGTWAIGGAGACLYLLVADNQVYNLAAVADVGINIASATGICVNNWASTGNASAAQITAPSMVKCQNYGGIIADSNGLLEPIAT